MRSLLAVDCGLMTGLALYADTGRLLWCRSKNFGKPAALRSGARTFLLRLRNDSGLSHLLVEGGGALADIWLREAARQGLEARTVQADAWRGDLLLRRERTSGREAKTHAVRVARRVIAWSGIALPPSVRHDTAEAVLAGLWGVLRLGWLDELPRELRS